MSLRPDDANDALLHQQLNEQLAGISPEQMEQAAKAGPSEAPRDERGRVLGRIIAVREDDVLVDLGGKSEAFLPAVEFDEAHPAVVGAEHWFVMHGRDRESGLMRLSLRLAATNVDARSLQVGDVLEGRVTGMNIGGLELQVQSIRAFMPKSQVELHRVEDFTPYIGRRLECEVTEVDRKGKRVVVSRRRLLEKKQAEEREHVKADLVEGAVRPGVVKRLTDFGAFVDIGGVEGLLHISDISYARLKHAKEVLGEGQEVQVKILKIDAERDRISLGMKQLEADPWELAESNYRPGTQIDGKVVKLMDFGAFVQLEEGVEGLIPISEMSHTQRLRHPKDMLSEGDSVRVSVLQIDPDKRKLTLSLKALTSDPWGDVAERYAEGAEISGAVTRIVDFGAFVQLEEGVEGLVHVSEISDKRIRTPRDVLKEGEIVKCRVKQVDPRARRISLTMKAQVATEGSLADYDPSARPNKERKKKLKGGLER